MKRHRTWPVHRPNTITRSNIARVQADELEAGRPTLPSHLVAERLTGRKLTLAERHVRRASFLMRAKP